MQPILIFGLVACLTVTADAISCYACESVYEPENCGPNFESENYFKVDCSRTAPPRYLERDLAFRNSTACLKMVYKESGVQKIMRSCFFGDVNETEIGCRMDPTLATIEDTACFVCDTGNFCNGGSELVAQTPAALLATFVAFVVTAKLWEHLKTV